MSTDQHPTDSGRGQSEGGGGRPDLHHEAAHTSRLARAQEILRGTHLSQSGGDQEISHSQRRQQLTYSRNSSI